MKTMFNLILILTALSGYSMKVQADCPTDRMKGFSGQFKGVLSAVTFLGERQPLENVIEYHTVTNCTSFDFDIHYSNPQTEQETRVVKFSGQWDENKKAFIVSGEIINGTLQVIREGQFLLDFVTKFAGKPAHCDEMIVIGNNTQEQVRSVHCFTENINGSSIGVRSSLTHRVP